jgi:plastocyanin
MHRSMILAAAVMLAVAGCSAAGGAGTNGTPPPDADVAVAAENFGFDTDEIRLTAGEETLVYFDNRDAEGHNVSIYREAGGEQLFGGEIVGGGGITYRIPPLEPGTYHFQCDPHPVMSGTVVVEEASP